MCEALRGDHRFGVVTDVFDGDGAVEHASEVDVVVVDLSVAGLGCLGTISHIHQDARRPAVIGLSTPGQEWLDPLVRSEGADDVIMWPADRDRFCDRLALAVRS